MRPVREGDGAADLPQLLVGEFYEFLGRHVFAGAILEHLFKHHVCDFLGNLGGIATVAVLSCVYDVVE